MMVMKGYLRKKKTSNNHFNLVSRTSHRFGRLCFLVIAKIQVMCRSFVTLAAMSFFRRRVLHNIKTPNKACGRLGVRGIFKYFSLDERHLRQAGFEFFLLPSSVHARMVVDWRSRVETHLPVSPTGMLSQTVSPHSFHCGGLCPVLKSS